VEVKNMICKEETKAVLLRLPLDVAQWTDKQAARTLASRNSEIVRNLRDRMDAEQRERAAS
jgi:hypothetical protein